MHALIACGGYMYPLHALTTYLLKSNLAQGLQKVQSGFAMTATAALTHSLLSFASTAESQT